MLRDFGNRISNCVSRLSGFIDSFPVMAIAVSSVRFVGTDSGSTPNVSGG